MTVQYVQALSNEVAIKVWVQPGASKTAVVGLHDGHLKIQLAAHPVDGKANAALVVFLAQLLGVPKKCVRLDKGENSRRKRILVTGVDVGAVLSAMTLVAG